jgi:hypothetical protein
MTMPGNFVGKDHMKKQERENWKNEMLSLIRKWKESEMN